MIPDDLYRRVKARSAMEGRSFRSVAVELLQAWLEGPLPSAVVDPESKGVGSAPWLAITRPALKPGMKHDLESIRSAIAAGWAEEATQQAPDFRKPS
jgi:hypothetical protein